MITEFVERWDRCKPLLRTEFSISHPKSYKDLVTNVVQYILSEPLEYAGAPDPERVHEIDDGDYQGTLVYVVGSTGYQPYTYWYTKVAYGSCSGCDTLQSICDYNYDDIPTSDQVDQYMTLALHIVQGFHKMGDD